MGGSHTDLDLELFRPAKLDYLLQEKQQELSSSHFCMAANPLKSLSPVP